MSPDLTDDSGAATPVLPLRLHASLMQFKNNTAATLRWVYPFRSSNRSIDQLHVAQEYVSVEVKMLSGIGVSLRTDCRQRLCTVSELVTGQTGILDNCQVIVVYESRRKSRGFGAAAQRIAHSWKARKSTRSLILGLINYICLPQVVSREFSGRGLYHWARGGLQHCLKAKSQGSITVQVHMLDGHAFTLDMLATSSVQDLQMLVQQESGLLIDRQQISIEEQLPPSKLLQLTTQLLLGSFAGLRAAGQAAFWAQQTLRRQLWGVTHFPLAVNTHTGQSVTVDATMDMTLAELHHAISHHPALTQPGCPFPIQAVSFPHSDSLAGMATLSKPTFKEKTRNTMAEYT